MIQYHCVWLPVPEFALTDIHLQLITVLKRKQKVVSSSYSSSLFPTDPSYNYVSQCEIFACICDGAANVQVNMFQLWVMVLAKEGHGKMQVKGMIG